MTDMGIPAEGILQVSTKKSIDIEPSTSEKFVQHYNVGLQQSTFESLPTFEGESDFGFYHTDVAVGRFGLFLRGPKDSKADIVTLGKGIIAALK